jgi:23S rRNA pseudouridine1911/1915/1917 synthase
VDKAAHLLTVPTPARENDTLLNHLQAYVSRGRKHLGRVGIVHRLDRGVSGVLVFTKTEAVAEMLRQQFAAAKPEREYVALVAGRMQKDRGTFDKRLAVDKRTIHRRCATTPGEGERAVTHYAVEKLGTDVTRVRVRLETGRRNQIRVHFADAGHPVLGDPRYGKDEARHRRWPHRRMALHAAVLAFMHPVTSRALRFEAPEPKEFADVWT